MGVLNVTPDSFSDGGAWLDAGRRDRARPARCVAEGADLVDVGGESTRPGAERVDARGGVRRVLPVVRGARRRGRRGQRRHHARRGRARPRWRPAPRSSTTSAAGWPTRSMARLVADAGRAVRRHALARAQPDDGRLRARTTTWSPTCARELGARLDGAVAAGVDAERIVLDPGLGFAKNAEHNWALLADLRRAAWRSGGRCSSAPPARGSSAGCCATSGGRAPAAARARRRRPRCTRCCAPRRGSGRARPRRARHPPGVAVGARCGGSAGPRDLERPPDDDACGAIAPDLPRSRRRGGR